MKLLIVDDHAVVREGLAAMLRHAEAITEVLQADGGDTGLAIAREQADLAVIMLDLAMPGMAGPAAILAFGQVRPDVPIIVLSASENPADAQAALDAGALGYVPKSASPKPFCLP